MSEIPMLTGLYEGRGVDPDTGKTFNVGVTFKPPQTLVNPQGQNSVMTIKVITSTSQMADLLNVSAAATVTTIKGGGSAEAKFLRDRTLNSYYLYALVKVIVENPAVTIRDVVLKDNAHNLLKEQGWDSFAQSYGLQYVEGYITGGFYYALLEIQTTDAGEKQEIASKLNGNYKGFGLKIGATAEANSQIQNSTKNYTTNVYVFQSGGSGDILETNLEDMIKQAQEFPKLVKESPVPIRAIINDYRNSSENIPPNLSRASLKFIVQKERLEDLGKSYLRLRDYKHNLQFTIDNLDLFDEYKNLEKETKKQKRKQLEDSLKNVSKEIDKVVRLATACAEDFNKCEIYTLPDTFFDSIDSILPEGDSMITPRFLSGNARKAFPPEYRTGQGERVDTVRVNFPDGTFKTPPTVQVSLKLIDIDHNKVIRADVYPINITTSGFDIAFRTWADTVVYNLDATWFAHT